jgi:hypothetical protein
MRRRTVLGSVLAATLARASTVVRPAAAQDATPDAAAMAAHPIVGAWMVATPAGPSLAVFFADGTNIQGLPAAQTGPFGISFVSPQVGRWEPTGPRRVHFTGVQLHANAAGALVGTVIIDGHPTVSDDGQTLRDDDPASGPTIWDATGAIIAAPRGDRRSLRCGWGWARRG